jgi:hypothetical protein
MHRMLICGLAALGWAPGLAAQAVPARDLWEFPLGAVFEPAALAVEPGAGLWNPATVALAAGQRMRFGVASLAAGSAQGVDGQLLGAALRRPSGATIGVSIARAAVAGLVRTDSDPQTVGEIQYASTLVSLEGARRVLPHVTAGAAVRWRRGQADQETRSAIAADLGVVLDELPWRHTRLAVSSFLWRPGREIDDRPALLAAGDLRLVGPSAQRELRGGFSYSGVNRGAHEQGPFLSGRLDRVEGRVGYFRTAAGGNSVTRVRSGVALRYARYVVGIAREEGASGLGPVYQFSLSSILQ